MKSGWVIKKLGEVCELINGKNQSEVANPSGKYPIYGSGGVMGRADDFRCPAGCTIIGRKGSINNPLYVTEPFWNVDTAYALSPTGVESKFLYYFCLSFDFSKLDCGTTIPSLTSAIVKDVDMPIPPLPEQKRIVAKIDAAFEKINNLKANAERNLKNAKELFQSALDEAMRPKKGWVEKRLGEVCDGRLSYGTSAPSCPYNGKVRYIRITDIDDEGRLLDELVSPKTFERKHILVEGDIVLARTGATVGKSYLYSPSDGDCVYAGYLIRARVNRSMVLPEFAFYFTKTGSYWQYIHTEQASAAQPNINAEKYGNLLMPVPPLKEQREIVAMARVIHGKSLKLQHHYTRQIADCAEMRQSVLREAFEGRL